jgi:hypothetical protein
MSDKEVYNDWFVPLTEEEINKANKAKELKAKRIYFIKEGVKRIEKCVEQKCDTTEAINKIIGEYVRKWEFSQEEIEHILFGYVKQRIMTGKAKADDKNRKLYTERKTGKVCNIETCKDIKLIERMGAFFERAGNTYRSNFERCLKRRNELAEGLPIQTFLFNEESMNGTNE